MTEPQYAFDPTGANAANAILNEEHVIIHTPGHRLSYVVPLFSPFFVTSVHVRRRINTTWVPLVEGVDYHCGLYFLGASESIGASLYSAITFTDFLFDGTVSVDYQTLGGLWTLQRDNAMNAISERFLNSRFVLWDSLIIPEKLFPEIAPLNDATAEATAEALVPKINELTTAILGKPQQAMPIRHLTNLDNPHHLTLSQLGKAISSNDDVAQRIPVDTLVTVEQTLQLFVFPT